MFLQNFNSYINLKTIVKETSMNSVFDTVNKKTFDEQLNKLFKVYNITCFQVSIGYFH